jgi:NADPH:quinone reductase
VVDLPIPQIGPDDVLIRVQAAGVNPSDIGFREGRGLPLSFPAIMGSDFAGTVAQVGEHVTTVRADTPVYGIAFGGGSYAEYMRVPATGEFATRPPSLDAVQAAGLPPPGMTALQAVDTAALAAGEVFLIVGGTGGIGSFAIQMAAGQGAQVLATGRAEDEEYLRRLGAAETLDYTRGEVIEAVRASYPDGIGAVLDVATLDPAAFDGLCRRRAPANRSRGAAHARAGHHRIQYCPTARARGVGPAQPPGRGGFALGAGAGHPAPGGGGARRSCCNMAMSTAKWC